MTRARMTTRPRGETNVSGTSRARGFTLVELSVVITIIGVLAVLATAGYRKLTVAAKITEAQNVISAIRIAQEDYRAEKGSYAHIGTNFCPAAGSGSTKTMWNPACDGGSSKWNILPVNVDGPVYFGYRVAAGGTNVTDPFSTGVDFSAANKTVPWYIIQAQADLDSNGTPYTQLTGTSFTNQIFTKNEGD